jgi:hypothetical protein
VGWGCRGRAWRELEGCEGRWWLMKVDEWVENILLVNFEGRPEFWLWCLFWG